jgi:ribosomal protein S18 acetylase RimI-like enzyme
VASEHSLCFGVYRNASKEAVLEQIGFARVVGDGVSFSSIMDVIIEGQYRRHGLGTMLMEEIIGHPDVKGTACILGTQFAFNPGATRRFYKKFGFNFCDGVMVRDPQ